MRHQVHLRALFNGSVAEILTAVLFVRLVWTVDVVVAPEMFVQALTPSLALTLAVSTLVVF